MTTEALGALAGVTVLDVSMGVAGPFCGKLLASLGATVIKVESPGRGDSTRGLPPFLPSSDPLDRSALFHHLNTGKLGLTLDLESEAGQAVFRRLVSSWATVVITSDSYLRARELGLDWESLHALKTDLLVSAISDFGMDGPLRDYAGSELVALALGGYLHLTGDPDREPLKPYGYQAQYHAGLHAATGTVAALFRLEATGKGEFVDTSTVEAAAFLCSAAPGWYYFTGEEPNRVGNRLANIDPRQFYPSTMRPCRDGWVHAHGNMRDPQLLEVLIGDPELGREDIRREPKGHADEIDAIMDRWLAGHDRAEAVELAQTLRVPFTEVFSPDEVLVNPHLAARGAFAEVEHPSIGVAKFPHASIRFSVTPWVTTRAPRLGEHTAGILSDCLGIAGDELAALYSAGVI